MIVQEKDSKGNVVREVTVDFLSDKMITDEYLPIDSAAQLGRDGAFRAVVPAKLNKLLSVSIKMKGAWGSDEVVMDIHLKYKAGRHRYHKFETAFFKRALQEDTCYEGEMWCIDRSDRDQSSLGFGRNGSQGTVQLAFYFSCDDKETLRSAPNLTFLGTIGPELFHEEGKPTTIVQFRSIDTQKGPAALNKVKNLTRRVRPHHRWAICRFLYRQEEQIKEGKYELFPNSQRACVVEPIHPHITSLSTQNSSKNSKDTGSDTKMKPKIVETASKNDKNITKNTSKPHTKAPSNPSAPSKSSKISAPEATAQNTTSSHQLSCPVKTTMAPIALDKNLSVSTRPKITKLPSNTVAPIALAGQKRPRQDSVIATPAVKKTKIIPPATPPDITKIAINDKSREIIAAQKAADDSMAELQQRHKQNRDLKGEELRLKAINDFRGALEKLLKREPSK
ncbi:hypothetical protein BT63DRAFT_412525 [Microthyrium microscopicum]|uniref:Uncharacterized protein n=1 Tax=Microthyrium microscopicum TaxID=703497 RepID=A0A6A6UI81_9PEZI|nr:hypothetical protein BT63DRAFT_412525 [Microthyrium microscopicum]